MSAQLPGRLWNNAVREYPELRAAQSIKKLAACTLIVLAGAFGLRLLWLYLGPPYLLSDKPAREEFSRLDKDCKKDLQGSSELLNRLAPVKTPMLAQILAFFLSANSGKYADCFTRLASRNLKDEDMASLALARAISLDRGWNGQEAAGIFAGHFAGRPEGREVSAFLKEYDPRFALLQLSRMKNEANDPALKACYCLALAGLLHKQNNDEAALDYLQKAERLFAGLENNGQMQEEKEELQKLSLELTGNKTD